MQSTHTRRRAAGGTQSNPATTPVSAAAAIARTATAATGCSSTKCSVRSNCTHTACTNGVARVKCAAAFPFPFAFAFAFALLALLALLPAAGDFLWPGEPSSEASGVADSALAATVAS